ncbi:hypothetical protein N9F34_01280 [Alphaproteobacteria bacterium]|nr:hypothetical protein [Alphaproteobacteria bacterium]
MPDSRGRRPLSLVVPKADGLLAVFEAPEVRLLDDGLALGFRLN